MSTRSAEKPADLHTDVWPYVWWRRETAAVAPGSHGLFLFCLLFIHCLFLCCRFSLVLLFLRVLSKCFCHTRAQSLCFTLPCTTLSLWSAPQTAFPNPTCADTPACAACRSPGYDDAVAGWVGTALGWERRLGGEGSCTRWVRLEPRFRSPIGCQGATKWFLITY